MNARIHLHLDFAPLLSETSLPNYQKHDANWVTFFPLKLTFVERFSLTFSLLSFN